MRKKNFVASLSKKLILLTERTPVSILMLVGLSTLAFIALNRTNYDISYRWWVFYLVGLIISVTVMLWLEDHVKNILLRHGLVLGCVALWGVYCFLLPPDYHLLYFADWLQIVVIGLVFFFSAFFISFLGKNKDHAYWLFSAKTLFQMLIAVCFGGLLLGGLCLATVSIETLFNVYMSEKVYGNLSIFCLLLFTPLYFLANIPNREKKHESGTGLNKTLKIMSLYILIPLLVIYAVILYVYLIRIVVAWELPNGWVSWLTSALAVGVLLIVTIIYPMRTSENHWTERFSRYAGVVILPLLALMTVGIVRRINDYDITINRCYILLLNVWFYGIYIYLYFSRARHIKWILITPVALVLLVSTGPWKFSSITKRILLNKMETIMDNRQLSLYDSTLWLNELEMEKKVEIRETIDYLADTYGKSSIQTLFKDNIENKPMYDVFADLNLYNLTETEIEAEMENNSRSFSFYGNVGSELLNLKGYQSCIVFSFDEYRQEKMEDKNIEIKLDSSLLNMRIISENRSIFFPIKDVALKQIPYSDKQETVILLEGFDNNNTTKDVPTRKYLLAITEIRGNYYTKKDSLEIYNMDGILFYK